MAPRYAIEYIDDLDDTPLDLDEVHTVRWSWLGVDYHLDTSTANLEKIEAGQVSLATVLAKSTRIGGRARSTAPKHHPRPDTPPPADGGVRVWARRQGYDIAERGRIPVAITRAYNDAH